MEPSNKYFPVLYNAIKDLQLTKNPDQYLLTLTDSDNTDYSNKKVEIFYNGVRRYEFNYYQNPNPNGTFNSEDLRHYQDFDDINQDKIAPPDNAILLNSFWFFDNTMKEKITEGRLTVKQFHWLLGQLMYFSEMSLLNITTKFYIDQYVYAENPADVFIDDTNKNWTKEYACEIVKNYEETKKKFILSLFDLNETVCRDLTTGGKRRSKRKTRRHR